MAQRAIVRIGDPTTHGGVVLTGISDYNVYGKEAAGVGDSVFCPRCEGHHVIVGGANSPTVFGRQVAVEGMFTTCGAQVISTLPDVVFDVPDGDGGGKANSANEVENHLDKNDLNGFDQHFQIVDQDGNPVSGLHVSLEKPDGTKSSIKTEFNGKTPKVSGHNGDEIGIGLFSGEHQ